ncbi:hypothetical protein X749_06600 [Mesorhizobium sp. LNJC391B00]|nr:hypothetical protein X749_06600 [Mesorhizobium sp. LNJC391B00]
MFFRGANKFVACKPANSAQNRVLRCKIMLQRKKTVSNLILAQRFWPPKPCQNHGLRDPRAAMLEICNVSVY